MRDDTDALRQAYAGTGLRPVAEYSMRDRLVRGTLVGNAAGALWRSRRAPLRAVRSARAARRDRGWRVDAPATGSSFRAAYVVLAGPGDREGLFDLIDSIQAFEGDEVKVVVVDDASVDCRERVVRARFPAVDVVRRAWPSSGPPANYPPLAAGIRHALANYEFDCLVKLDTDALVTGAAPSRAALELFGADPCVGMAGTLGVRADGVPEAYDYDVWTLRHTERWSPGARSLMKRARAAGYDGSKVHGGVYVVSRAALDGAARAGYLSWRSPWWTPLSEDFWLSVAVLAAGFRLASFGGPGEPFAVGSKFLPLPKEEVLREGKLAIHSVRRGMDGASEDELRRFFRDARHGSATPAASAPPGR